jgi:putative methionine-R-sulfoxide reductase with GAF domain
MAAPTGFDRNYAALADRVRLLTRSACSREERMRIVVDALWHALHDHAVSWVGFYLDQPAEPDDRRLVLGPSRNKPACSPIGLHGACGKCLLSRKPLIVRDVKDLGPDYIACDPRDRSEIVVPLIDAKSNECWGVLDLDSYAVGAFDERDERGLRDVLRAAGL